MKSLFPKLALGALRLHERNEENIVIWCGEDLLVIYFKKVLTYLKRSILRETFFSL